MRKIFYVKSAVILFMFLAAAFPASGGQGEPPQDARVRPHRHGGVGEAREAAGARMREIESKRARIREEMHAESLEIRELAGEYRKARTDAERNALRQEMKSVLEEGFQRRHAALRERLEDLRRECREIENRLKQDLENKDEIVDMRLERILEGPGRPRAAPGRGRGTPGTEAEER